MKRLSYIIFVFFLYCNSSLAQKKEHSKLKVGFAYLEESKVQPIDSNLISLDLEAKIPSTDSINGIEIRFLDIDQNILYSKKASVKVKNNGTKYLEFNEKQKIETDPQMKIKTRLIVPKDVYFKSNSKMFFVEDKTGLLTNRTYLRQR